VKDYFSIENKQKRIKYFSNAEWTKIGNSSDQHDNIEFARGICERLMSEYNKWGRECDTRGKCLRTWVTIGKAGSYDERVKGRRDV